MKLINELDEHLREEAVNSLVFEAEALMHNPVYGCTAVITNLQRKLKQAETDLYNVKKELATYIGPEAMMPASLYQPVMALHVGNPPLVVYVNPQRRVGKCLRMGVDHRAQLVIHSGRKRATTDVYEEF
ncbi:hypothetical protein EZV62_024009 [Acer yangbiense]|uniref:LOB domain-containing protein n=1 Tax=Acer yangbiense TaxID=1000413 RepID=A0A5C7H456_9ROSI|nr:hypothetical protein EZV62_024009 [Acer yangbiense]